MFQNYCEKCYVQIDCVLLPSVLFHLGQYGLFSDVKKFYLYYFNGKTRYID